MRYNARRTSESNDRLGATMRENSEKEIAARDRVDITLAEYMTMKKDIDKLSEENRRLKLFVGKIGLPFDAPIIPDSVHKMTCCDTGGFMDFTQRFIIEFRCDMSVLSPEQREHLVDGFCDAHNICK